MKNTSSSDIITFRGNKLQNKLFKSTFILVLIGLISKFIGFLRDSTIAFTFGASKEIDAYFIAQTVPLMIFGVVGTALTITLVPVFVRLQQKHSFTVVNRFYNLLINHFLLLALVIILLTFIFTDEIVRFIAPGFEGEQFRLTVNLTRISVVMIIFMGLNDITISFLQAKNKFLAPSLVGISMSIIIIIYLIFFGTYYSIYVFMVATLLAYFSQFVIQIPSILKQRWRYKLIIDFTDNDFKKALALAIPTLVGAAVDQVNILVDRILASGLISGSISALTYSSRISGLVTGLFFSSLAAVIYPYFSNAVTKNDFTTLRKYLVIGIEIILVISIPITLFISFMSDLIIDVAFERGAFDSKATEITSLALFFYSFSIFGIMLRDLLIRCYYSLEDVKTPMKSGIIAVIFNVVLSMILVKFFQVGGLTLATSISLNITSIFLYFNLVKKLNIEKNKFIVSTFIKVLSASLLTVFSLMFISNEIFILNSNADIIEELLYLIWMFLIYIVLYFILIFIFKVSLIRRYVPKFIYLVSKEFGNRKR